MSKVNDIRTEIYKKLGVRAKKSVFIFDAGKLTSQGKPWFRTVITDSDQGPIATFLLSDGCFESQWKDTIIQAILASAQSHRVISLNDTGSGETFTDQIEKANATVYKSNNKREKQVANLKPKRRRVKSKKIS